MTKEEVNKVIAEFMNLRIIGTFLDENNEGYWDIGEDQIIKHKFYTDSLDVLIPVWEKLDSQDEVRFERLLNKQYLFWFSDAIYAHQETLAETIQEAAAIATAKAILELTKTNTTSQTTPEPEKIKE